MPRRKDNPGRTCDICGQTYSRRNRIEAWDGRNPGHRDGWHKTVAKICLNCQSAQQTQRILILAQVNAVKKGATG